MGARRARTPQRTRREGVVIFVYPVVEAACCREQSKSLLACKQLLACLLAPPACPHAAPFAAAGAACALAWRSGTLELARDQEDQAVEFILRRRIRTSLPVFPDTYVFDVPASVREAAERAANVDIGREDDEDFDEDEGEHVEI